MNLTKLCKELNNWFEYKKVFGVFHIEDGKIKEDLGLLEGQHYRIADSVFNDGVHMFGTKDLKSETFDGAIWLMAVPQEVISLCEKITDWESKYAEAISSPYTSESFGGYSYTKMSSSGLNGGSNAVSFKNSFFNELNNWRKA